MDRVLDLMIGEGPSAQAMRMLPRHPGRLRDAPRLLTTPLRDRFGIPLRLVFTTIENSPALLPAPRRHCFCARSHRRIWLPNRGAARTPQIAGRCAPGARFPQRQRTGTVDRVAADRALNRLGSTISGSMRWTAAI
jgi:Holliday junction DNA helicase RuvB